MLSVSTVLVFHMRCQNVNNEFCKTAILALLGGYLRLRVEHILNAFENRVLRVIFGPKKK